MNTYGAPFLMFFIGLTLFNAPSRSKADELPAGVLKKLKTATVFVKVSAGGKLRGSGFFVSQNVVVTNAHVLGVTSTKTALPTWIELVMRSGEADEQTLVASVMDVDVRSDLAFLSVPDQLNIEPLEIRPSTQISETLPVFILGFPLAEQIDRNKGNPAVTIASGQVSSLRRNAQKQIQEIQIDGSIIPGNSGGPIVDAKGDLVAVSVSAIVGLNIGFSIPGDSVKANMVGRIENATFTYLAHEKGEFTVKAKVSTVDPLDKIKKLSLHYWTCPQNSFRPLDPAGKFSAHGADDDSPRKQVELTLDPNSHLWTGEIPHFSLQSDQEFWVQPCMTLGQEEKMTAAVNHANNLRESVLTPGGASNSKFFETGVDSIIKPRALLRYRRPISAKRETDTSGYPITTAKSSPNKVSIGRGRIDQMLADPSGDKLYVLFADSTTVTVFDPNDFKVISQINVPRKPVSIWCDSEQLIVACEESKVVVFVDTKTLKIVRSIRNTVNKELKPNRIIGRIQDGSLMSTWSSEAAKGKPERSEQGLYLLQPNGKAEHVFSGRMEWCALPNKETLWVQSNFSGSPSGKPSLISLQNGEIKLNNFEMPFCPQGVSMHRSCGPCFTTLDGKLFLVPTEASGFAHDSGYTTTLAVKPDLSEVIMNLPGNIVAEYPEEDCFVTWQQGVEEGYSTGFAQIMYSSRSTGRTVRKIIVKPFSIHNSIFTSQQVVPAVIFIPGHELLIYRDRHAADATIYVVQCGPISPTSKVSADPSLAIENDPPKIAYVGKLMEFVPIFKRPENVKKIDFQISKGIEGMEIDPTTGKISLRPTDENLGIYELDIIATMDDIEVSVLKWRLEIELQ